MNAATRSACPICGKPPLEAYRPFCCKRCADVDLQRWFAGSYRLDGGALDDPEASADPSED
jgi:endogenous inhibitor of DNA gyrase (YacG/DUF329 family)